MIAYALSAESGAFDLWEGVPIGQPTTPSAVRTGVVDAAYFGKQVQDNLLACIAASVAPPTLRQVFACSSGLATGQPVYASDDNAVALASASGSGSASLIGFVRDKTEDGTGCYLAQFARISGTFATGATIYLSNSGGFSTTAGTFIKPVGVGVGAGIALACASLAPSVYVGGNPSTAAGSASSGASAYASRADHVHTITGALGGAPGTVGTGSDSGTSSSGARADHTHALANAVAAMIPYVVISGNAESGDYRAITVSARDANGSATGSRLLVEAWLADTGYGWETATAPTGFVIASGITGDTPTANARLRGITLSDGTITYHVNTDAAITYVFVVSVGGKLYQTEIAFS